MIPGKHINVVLLLLTVVACCSCRVNNGTFIEGQQNSNATRQARVNHQQQQINNQGFCTGTNGVAGVCMTRMACTRGGGTQLGFGGCGTYNICCDVPSPCNSNTPFKNKYISLKTPSTIPDRCTYKIQPYSTNVCQLRFDFMDVSLAQPSTTGQTTGACESQSLNINDMILCGDLSDQHLYVPIDQTNGIFGSEFSLQILTEIVNSPTTSRWNIRVTQLECPQPANTKKNGLFTIPRQSTLQDLRRMLMPKSNDADLLAPQGCDQYFVEPSAKIRSFNYRAGGLGQYPQSLHYTICFKKGAGDRTLELGADANSFQMGFDEADLPAGEAAIDQYCRQPVPTPGISNDYLMVPPSTVYTFSPVYDAVFFCGNSLAGQKVMTEGPFILIFHSDGETGGSEAGFELDYSIY